MTPGNRPEVKLKGNNKLLNFHMAEMVVVHPITGADIAVKSVEHYFQGCKALFLEQPTIRNEALQMFDAIVASPTPREAKELGRNINIYLPLWNRASFAFMLQGHIAKFSQNVDLMNELVATGTARIVEDRPDPLWGRGPDGRGKNLCGRSLMIVRRMSRDWVTA